MAVPVEGRRLVGCEAFRQIERSFREATTPLVDSDISDELDWFIKMSLSVVVRTSQHEIFNVA